MRYLGCQQAPVLEIGDYKCSYYDVNSNKIYISREEKIKDYKSYISKILHLSHHVYEYEQIELLQKLRKEENAYANLLLFTEAIQWEEDSDKYTGCNKKCKNLYMESSAEAYAVLSYQEYLDCINEYWRINYNEEQFVEGGQDICMVRL